MEVNRKPNSMSVREWLSRSVSSTIIVPENIIKQVVTHQFDSAHEALKTNNSVEISGFGKFFYNVKKAAKEYEKCLQQKIAFEKVVNDETATEKKRHAYSRRIDTVEANIKALKDKKNGRDS